MQPATSSTAVKSNHGIRAIGFVIARFINIFKQKTHFPNLDFTMRMPSAHVYLQIKPSFIQIKQNCAIIKLQQNLSRSSTF